MGNPIKLHRLSIIFCQLYLFYSYNQLYSATISYQNLSTTQIFISFPISMYDDTSHRSNQELFMHDMNTVCSVFKFTHDESFAFPHGQMRKI